MKFDMITYQMNEIPYDNISNEYIQKYDRKYGKHQPTTKFTDINHKISGDSNLALVLQVSFSKIYMLMGKNYMFRPQKPKQHAPPPLPPKILHRHKIQPQV